MAKGQYDRAEARKRREALLASAQPAERAKARWSSLRAPWQGVFLETWRDEKSRIKAAAACGKTIEEIDIALEETPAFFQAFELVQREITVALEDAQLNAALEGKSAGAQKLALEAMSARYQKKGTGRAATAQARRGRVSGLQDGADQARKTWGAIFQTTRSQENANASPAHS